MVLDYKTDRVKTGKELADRYASQLKLYGEALSGSTTTEARGRSGVKERLLYSSGWAQDTGVSVNGHGKDD